ncbi:MAG: L,D-transpeptidase family protein [Cytophagales bacterium]|nr:L,D-transpeptidase family protein [Cytophagales bacterium]
MKSKITFITFLAFQVTSISLSGKAEPDEFIRKKAEELQSGLSVELRGELIYCETILPKFYLRRDFEPAWSSYDLDDLKQILADAELHGLDPFDYHYAAILKASNGLSSIEQAELDLVLTDAFLLYASHFLNGKINPETVDSEWKAIRREGNALEFLELALLVPHLADEFASLAPQHQGYADLKGVLARYKSIESRGGWKVIPEGETLKPGMIDWDRVPLIVDRLKQTGDIDSDFIRSPEYTEQLSLAIEAYQIRNGLDPDGHIGKATLVALNESVKTRIGQIMINLERYRWIAQGLGDHYVMVNIANYRMEVYKDGALTFQEKVIVGKPFRKTPVFSGKMTYLVFNPTWTVPPTILFDDILPEVKKSTEYLKTKNMVVLKGQGSSLEVVDPETVDWSSLSRNYFPYTLRQQPGPTNALGLVKFMFPNAHNVYIHDTPSKELFNRVNRAFSSGCIRLDRPMEFAKYLLQEDESWNAAKIAGVLKEGIERSVILKHPLPVHILYLTSWVKDGQVQFRKDLYERDLPVLEALKSKPPSL